MRKCARENDLHTQSDGEMNDDDAVAFIETRRGQAGQPVECRAAPPAASIPPRRCLGARPAGAHAPVGDDATGVVERRWAAMMRPAGLPPSA